MSKKTLSAVLVILLIIAAAGGYWLSRIPPPITEPTAEPTSIPETNIADVEDSNFDDQSEETRIILSEPDDQMLSELLSDKVIRADKIVNKSQASEKEQPVGDISQPSP